MAIKIFSTSTITQQAKYPTFAGELFLGQGYGYAAGGGSSGGYTNTVYRLNFNDDSVSTLPVTLSTIVGETDGMSSPTAGYTLGGDDATALISRVSKLTFAGETLSVLASGLSSIRRLASGTSTTTHGYAMGGINAPGRTSTVDKFVFSTDSRSTLGTGLSSARDFHASFESSSYGYVLGGNPTQNTAQRVNFSTDTFGSLATGLNALAARAGWAGWQSSTTGYYGGGYDGSYRNAIYKLSFADDTQASLAATLTYSPEGVRAVSSKTNGYPIAGQNAGGYVTTINKFNFATETNAANANNLPAGRARHACFETGESWQ